MKDATEHFEEEAPHTAIKHKLFKSVFDSCMSISSSFNNQKREKRTFAYLDLYAGTGIFEDNNLGSPLIALNSINTQLNKESNNISKVNFIMSEQNSENASKLRENITNYISNNSLSNKVFPVVKSDSWENCTECFSKNLSSSDWGMIFVDPFSVELKIPDLLKIITPYGKLKDVLILINTNAHERILGRSDNDSLQKISDYFGVELKMVRLLKNKVKNVENLNNAIVIQRLIRRAFKNVEKDFIINLAITRSRNKNLENSNRFYLCLLTSSYGVANAFLDTYAGLLNDKKEKANNGQRSLFDTDDNYTYFQLKEKIKDITKGQKMSLLKLMSKLLNDFYSWKDASPNEIPNTRNVQKAINLLVEEKFLQTESNNFIKDNHFYKDGKRLKSTAFQNKKNLREIFIFNL